MSAEQILTRPQREARVTRLLAESTEILDRAIERHITADGKALAATCLLFSGGNDSTVLAHMFRDVATHAIHANTTIGIEATRDFVRNTCEEWGLPLIEKTPPNERDHYRALVLAHGFPGPGQHFKMYQRLKERGLRAAKRELITNPRAERVVFLAGRRRDESARRGKGKSEGKGVPESGREGSTVWVSPLVNWTKADLNTYRLMHQDVPVNDVANLLHMSGECLCGAFAKMGEREEVGYWFPEFTRLIEGLEAEIADRDDIADYRKTWGWGADRDQIMIAMARADELNYQGNLLDLIPSESGPLCSSCEGATA